jgi:predicted NUDIX family NTP pyrophosphohydrolase
MRLGRCNAAAWAIIPPSSSTWMSVACAAGEALLNARRPISAGVVVYRRRGRGVEFLLVHPGGPYWRNKDAAAWSIPKGMAEDGEDLAAAAAREFREEVGQPVVGDLMPLTPCRQPGGKVVHAWSVEADLDLDRFRSNLFEMEWPRGSGRICSFPEVDRAAYFSAEEALGKLHRGLRPILLDAMKKLGVSPPTV